MTYPSATIDELLEILLTSPSFLDKTRASRKLVELNVRKPVIPLIEALADSNADVKIAAVQALGGLGDSRAVKPLIRVLESRLFNLRDESNLRALAAQALGNIGDRDAIDPLIKALLDSRWHIDDEFVDPRWYIIRALEQFGDSRAIYPLITVMRQVADLRIGIGNVLVAIGDKRAVNPLIDLLNDSDPWLRGRAAVVLGDFGDEHAAGPLSKLLSDDIPHVRREAVNALRKIGKPALPAIINVLQEKGSLIPALTLDEVLTLLTRLSPTAEELEPVRSLLLALLLGSAGISLEKLAIRLMKEDTSGK